MIAVYTITVLIKTSAKFESHYNLLAVSCYLGHLFSASFQIQVPVLYIGHIACSYLHCSKPFKDMECTLLPTICNYYYNWMASCTSGLSHIKKTMKLYVIDSNNLINIRVSQSGLDHLVTDFVTFCVNLYLFVLSCTSCYSAIFLKIVKMWVSPLVHDAIQLYYLVPICTYGCPGS